MRDELHLAGLNERAAAWTAGVANVRVHATTGVMVQQRWEEQARSWAGSTSSRPTR